MLPTRLFAALLPVGFLCVSLCATQDAQAQPSDLGETIERVGGDYAARYVQPVVDAVGAGLNSSFFHQVEVGSGPIPGVDVYVGVKAFGTFVPEEDQTLDLRYAAREQVTFNGETYAADVTYDIQDAPTVFGEEESQTVTATAVYEVDGEQRTQEVTFETLPGVFETSIAPLAVPQAGVGIPLIGTHVSVRYLPRIAYEDLGSVQLTGGGVRHDISSYVPALPVALALHGFYQAVSIEESGGDEVVDASAFALGASASRSVAAFSLYGGLQYERTTADLSYTFDPSGSDALPPGTDDGLGPQTITLDLEGANTFRVLAGVSLGLGPAALNVDFSQGQRSVLSAGLGVSL